MGEYRKNQVLEGITLTDMAAEGRALARVNHLVVFVDGAVPGDVADVRITKVKSNFLEGRLVKLQQPSPHRQESFCEHFGVCGGCLWQHLDYKMQLVYKQKHVEDVLHRLGKTELPPAMPILASPLTRHYRNRLDFAFSDSRWYATKEEIDRQEGKREPALGFHVPRHFDKILDINTCHLQDDLSNQIRNTVKALALEQGLSFFNPLSQEGLLRNMVIRNTTTGEWMVIIIFRYDMKEERERLLDELSRRFPQINSLLYIINTKRNDTIYDLAVNVYKGKEYITEVMPSLAEGGTLKFKISAKSFYQTNPRQAYHLYKAAADFASLTGSENVYDLYTGTGTIACFVASGAAHVTGIDYIADAIEDARGNAKANDIGNASFFSGDLKETFTAEFVKEHGLPDVVITDPPRAGMHEEVISRLLEIQPGRIVYVSCNPSTQARDINMLSSAYKVEKFQPVDMFPHTAHVENVALLVKR